MACTTQVLKRGTSFAKFHVLALVTSVAYQAQHHTLPNLVLDGLQYSAMLTMITWGHSPTGSQQKSLTGSEKFSCSLIYCGLSATSGLSGTCRILARVYWHLPHWGEWRGVVTGLRVSWTAQHHRSPAP